MVADPYAEFPDVLPMSQAPRIYRGQTTYDSRQGGPYFERHFREQQAQALTRELMQKPEFFWAAPQVPGMSWLVDMRFEALVLTQREWDSTMAKQYSKGVQATQHMDPWVRR